MDGFKINKLKESQTINETAKSKSGEQADLKKSWTLQPNNVAALNADKKSKKTQDAALRIDEKKKTEEKIKSSQTKVIREIKDVKKPSQKNRRREAELKIKIYREELANAESTIFKDYTERMLTRESFDSFGAIGKKKRINEAIEREDTAARIEEYMNTDYKEDVDYGIVFKQEDLKGRINMFLNGISEEEYDIDSDEHFAASLKSNYNLVKIGARMKKWIQDAVDGGYLPDGVDMHAVQKKIAYFDNLKEYLDARVAVVTSPYYKYFSSDDLKYSDRQLNDFITKFDSQTTNIEFRERNKELVKYLVAVQKLRQLDIKRKSGISSIHEKIEKRAQHEVEIMQTRRQKMEAIEKLTEKSLHSKGCARLTDKNFDARYNKEKFDLMVADFESVSLSDLHFADLKDMSDNYDTNSRLFEQARDVEHLLSVAARRGDLEDWSDQKIINLRAKLRAFDACEKLFVTIQADVVVHSEEAVNDHTHEELWQRACETLGVESWMPDVGELPKFGGNLEKFYKSILKTYKEEHKNRKSTIKTMYGLMYPVKNEDSHAEMEWVPGQISDEELERRSRDFQKNAVITDYVVGADQYTKFIVINQFERFRAAYKKKNGIDVHDYFKPVRTMMRYVCGKSADEMSSIAETLIHGTEKEKKEFWHTVYREAYEADIREATGDSVSDLIENSWYKDRMGGMLGNIDCLAKELPYFDDQEKKNLGALYHLGTNNFETVMNLGQQCKNLKLTHGLTLEDLCKANDNANEMGQWLDSTYLDADSRHTEYKVGGHKYADRKNVNSIYHILSIPSNTLNKRSVTYTKPASAKAEKGKVVKTKRITFAANAECARYDEFRRSGAWTDTTADDLAIIRKDLQAGLDLKLGKTTQTQNAIDVLSIDLKEFELKSYKDINASKIAKLRPVILKAGELLDLFKAGANAEAGFKGKLSTALGEKGLRELEIRCRTISAAGTLFGPRMLRMMEIFDKEKDNPDLMGITSLDDMLHRPESYYAQLKKEAGDELKKELGEIEDFIKSLSGFDLFSSLTVTQDRIRRSELYIDRDQDETREELEEAEEEQTDREAAEGGFEDLDENRKLNRDMKELLEDEDFIVLNKRQDAQEADKKRRRGNARFSDRGISPQALVNRLLGKTGAIGEFQEEDVTLIAGTVSELIGPVAARFKEKKISVHEREALLNKAGSIQNHKFVVSRTFRDNKIKYESDVFKIKNSISLATKIKLGDSALEDLAALMKGNFEVTATTAKEWEEFARTYADKDSREQAMDLMTRSIIALPLNALEGVGAGDYRLAGNTMNLENISRKAYAYKRLLDANPEYVKRLQITSGDSDRTDYDRIMEKLDQMFVFSDYYRAAKLLMTDSYYILHGNDEIGLKPSADMTKDERRVYDLMKLTDHCARRIKNGLFEGRRNESNQDDLLADYEKRSARQAYVTGRPDLTKARPADVKKAHDKIRSFMLAFENPTDVKNNILNYDPKKDTAAAKHMTDDVASYLEGYKIMLTERPKFESDPHTAKTWTDKQKKLYQKFSGLCRKTVTTVDKNGKETTKEVEAGSLGFSDGRDGGENLYADPVLSRFAGDLARVWSDDNSEEELIDMMEGLTLTFREDLNMDDEATYQYARTRWLKSVKKMFDLLYNNVKRYERTYGTLQTDMTTPCFLRSLGSGQKDYALRIRFGQDLTQICAMNTCTYKGRSVSLGEVLVEEGLLERSELEDAIAKCPEYYQIRTAHSNNVYHNPISFFRLDDPDSDPSVQFSTTPQELAGMQNNIYRNEFEGPKLSYAEQRKFYKEALDTGYRGVTGGAVILEFKKKSLNLLSRSERRALKLRRAKDLQIFRNGCNTLDERADALYERTLDKLKAQNLTDDNKTLIKKMMAFHPGFYRDVKDNAPEIAEFESALKNFLGIGVNKADAIRLKREAFKYFTDMAGALSSGIFGADPDGIMQRNDVRTAEGTVLGSDMLKLETSHRMFDVLQDMAADQKNTNWLTSAATDELKEKLFKNLRLEVIRLTMSANYYLGLNDLGGHHESIVGRRYLALLSLGQNMTQFSDNSLENCVYNDPEIMKALKEYGVRVDVFTDNIKSSGISYETRKVSGNSLFREDMSELNVIIDMEDEDLEVAMISDPILENKPEQEKQQDKEEQKQQAPVEQVAMQEQLVVKQEENKQEESASDDVIVEPIPAGVLKQNQGAGEKIFLENDSPELIRHFAAERKDYRIADYPEQTKAHYEALLRKKKFAVPTDMENLVAIRGKYTVPKSFLKINDKGEQVESTDYFWRAEVDPVFKEAYDWLIGYYRAHMYDFKEVEPIPYNKQATAPLKGEHTKYEYQGNTLYCWACTMNGLMNEYAGKKVSDLNMIKSRPLNIPSFEESGFTDRKKYNEGVQLAKDLFDGEDTGNLTIFGDHVIEKLPNTAICTANIGRAPGKLNFCKRRFLETLGTRLEKGPVGLLFAGHFVLVYAINGDDLMVRDSGSRNSDELVKYKYSAEHIFSRTGQEVELVWLENIKGREQNIAREYNLDYNEKNKSFSGRELKEKETILHKNGIEGTKPCANGDLVSYQIYVPRQITDQEVQQVEEQPQQQGQKQEDLVSNKVAGDAIFKEAYGSSKVTTQPSSVVTTTRKKKAVENPERKADNVVAEKVSAYKNAADDVMRFYEANIENPSPELETFTGHILSLSEYLKGKGQTEDENLSEGEIVQLKKLYDQCSVSVSKYLNTLRDSQSGELKVLQDDFQNKIKYISEMIEKDRKGIDQVDAAKGITIKQLLSGIRTELFNADNAEISEYVGGNINRRLHIKKDGQEFAFTESKEILVAQSVMDKAIERYPEGEAIFQSIKTNDNAKSMVAGLFNLVQDDFMAFKEGKATDENKAHVADHFNQLKAAANIELDVDKLMSSEDFLKSYYDVIGELKAAIDAQANNNTAFIKEGRSIEKRNVAMTRVAEIMGMSSLIAHSKTASIVHEGVKKTGVIMEWVNGMTSEQIKESKGAIDYSGDKNVLQQLADIEVLDFICGNVDRHMGNLIYTVEDNRIVSVKGVDNDSSFGNLKGAPGEQAKFMTVPKDILIMRHRTASMVMSLTKEDLQITLGELLAEDEIDDAWSRVEVLKAQIRNSANEKPEDGKLRPGYTRILADNDRMWSEVDIPALAAVCDKKNDKTIYKRIAREFKTKGKENVTENIANIDEFEYKAAQAGKTAFLDVNIPKKGQFTENQLRAAQRFEPELIATNNRFTSELYTKMGMKDITDCIYVGSEKLKDYLQKNYSFKYEYSDANKLKCFRAYMCAFAANSALTMTYVHPQIGKSGEPEIVICDLDCAFENETAAMKTKREELESNARQTRKDRHKSLQDALYSYTQYMKAGVKLKQTDISKGAYRKENQTYMIIQRGELESTAEKCEYIFGTDTKNLPAEAKMHLAGNTLMNYCGLGGQIMEVNPVYGTDEAGGVHYGVRIASNYAKDDDYSLPSLENMCREGREAGNPVRIEYTADAIRQLTGIRLMLSLLGDTDADPVNDLRCVIHKVERNEGSVVFISGIYLKKLSKAFSKSITGKDLKKDHKELKALDLKSLPAIDKETADRILSLDKEKLKSLVGDMLGEKELEAMNSRLEYIQGAIKDEMEKDMERPEKEKRVLSGDKWQEQWAVDRLQRDLRKNPDSIFEFDLEGMQINIEGSLNKKEDEVPQPEWEKLYEKMYGNLMKAIKSAANASEALEIITSASFALTSNAYGKANTLEFKMADEMLSRIYNGLMTKELINAYVADKFASIREIIDTVTAKIAEIDSVPKEYRNEREIKDRIESKVKKARKNEPFDEEAVRQKATAEVESRLKEQYAIALLVKEKPSVFIKQEHMKQVPNNTGEMSFRNKTMKMEFAGSAVPLITDSVDAFAKEYAGGKEKYTQISDRGEELIPQRGNFDLLSPEKEREATDAYTDAITADTKFFVQTVIGLDQI